MAERKNAELGLLDGLTADFGGPRAAALLDRLEEAVPWKRLLPSIDPLLPTPFRTTGRA